ncbi:hypothetical protein FSST1_012832 [Fusarium sambucinum]
MATDKRGRQPPGLRPHRKSRNGCLQCKQRHAKCDEFRPACVGCTSSGRRCSYLDLLPIVRPGLSPDVHHPSVLLSPLSSAATPASTGSTCLTTTGLGVDAENVAGSSPMPPTVVRPIPTSPLRFEMRHLILMHHLDTVVLKDPFVSPEPNDRGPINISKVIVESAETVPYLVIEALALSSAHLGTTQTDPAERMKHSQAAEELQAQALSLFNQAHLQITEENCIPIFLFSSLTGMHALFNISDAKSSQFIAEFIQYLQVHRGVRLVIGDCWRIICNSGIIQHVDVFNALTLDQPKTLGPVDESDILVGLLSDSRSTLGADIFGVYIRATESLQQIYQNHRSLPPQCATQHDHRLASHSLSGIY